LNDIEEMRNQKTNGAKQLIGMESIMDGFDSIPLHLPYNEIATKLDAILDDYHVSMNEDSFAEEILIKSHLRKLRNLYIVLMEVCNRDEKLLAW